MAIKMLPPIIHLDRAILLVGAVLLVFCVPTGVLAEEKISETERLNGMILRLSKEGKYQEALPLAKKLVQQAQVAYGTNSRTHLFSYLSLAKIYRKLGNFAEAKALLLDIEPAYNRFLHPDDVYISLLHLEIGRTAYEMGDIVTAENSYSEALRKSKIHNRDKDLENTISALNGLAAVAEIRGNYQKQLDYNNSALEMFKNSKKNSSSQLAQLLTSQAVSLMNMNKFMSAEQKFKESLAVYRKLYGYDHLEIIDTLNNLGLLYIILGDYNQAEIILNRSVSVAEKNIGKYSLEIIAPLSSLAYVHTEAGQYSIAEQEFFRALSIAEKIYGPMHHKISIILNNFSIFYGKIGRYDQAGRLLERALFISQQVEYSKFPGKNIILYNLSAYAFRIGNFDKARTLLHQALETAQKLYDPESLDIADILQGLGVLLVDAGEQEDFYLADQMLNNALNIRYKHQKIDHPRVKGLLRSIGRLHLRQGKIDLARLYFIDADSHMGLGQYALAVGDYAEAIQHFSKNFKIKDTAIDAKIGLALALEGLNRLEEASDNFQEAIECIENQWYTLNLGEKGTFLDGYAGSFKRIEAYMGMVRVLVKLSEQDHNTASQALSAR